MALYLADTSAWHRSGRAEQRWSSLLDQDALALCAPVTLELLYSARGPSDYRALAEALAYLPTLPLNARVEAVAARTQAALARRSGHRGPTPLDILVAGVAEAHGATLLHYDRHFDLIAAVTGQPAEWLTRRGSLE